MRLRLFIRLDLSFLKEKKKTGDTTSFLIIAYCPQALSNLNVQVSKSN